MLNTKKLVKILKYVQDSKKAPPVKEIKEKLKLDDEEQQRYFSFCEEHHFTKYIPSPDKKVDLDSLELQVGGLEFLIDQEKIEVEREHSRVISQATWVIAIMAIIQVVFLAMTYFTSLVD